VAPLAASTTGRNTRHWPVQREDVRPQCSLCLPGQPRQVAFGIRL
jgi:hypothetical protein